MDSLCVKGARLKIQEMDRQYRKEVLCNESLFANVLTLRQPKLGETTLSALIDSVDYLCWQQQNQDHLSTTYRIAITSRSIFVSNVAARIAHSFFEWVFSGLDMLKSNVEHHVSYTCAVRDFCEPYYSLRLQYLSWRMPQRKSMMDRPVEEVDVVYEIDNFNTRLAVSIMDDHALSTSAYVYEDVLVMVNDNTDLPSVMAEIVMSYVCHMESVRLRQRLMKQEAAEEEDLRKRKIENRDRQTAQKKQR
jgi:hypothetical protein